MRGACSPARRARLLAPLLALLLVAGMGAAPLPAVGAPEVGGLAVVVTTEGDTLALRAGPGRGFAVLTAFAAGTVLTVLAGPLAGADGLQWYQVRAGKLTGWCWADYLAAPGTPAVDAATPPSAPSPPPAPAASPAPAATPPPAPAPPAERSAMRVGATGGKGARLHEAPGLGTAILMVIPEGEAVIVTGATQSGDGYDWAPVEYGAAAGWVATVLLVRGDAGASAPPAPAAPAATAPAADPAPPTALAVGDHAAVSGTGGLSLRIRGDAALDAPVYAAAPAGAVLLVIAGARTDGRGVTWYNVDYDGLQGWVVGDFLARTAAPLTARDTGAGVAAAAQPPPAATPAPAPPQPAPEATTPHLSSPAAPPPAAPATTGRGRAIADEALRHVGARYVWGGTTPAGWDCSGMVFYLYKQVAGVTLPRTTQQQFQVGATIDLGAIQAGDIVFFADTGGHGITHNGIALGDGRFVHAASEGSGTIISSLSNLYWAKHFAGARRP